MPSRIVVAERERVTLVLADDHVVVRAGLRLVLENAGIEVLAEAEDAEGAVRMVRKRT